MEADPRAGCGLNKQPLQMASKLMLNLWWCIFQFRIWNILNKKRTLTFGNTYPGFALKIRALLRHRFAQADNNLYSPFQLSNSHYITSTSLIQCIRFWYSFTDNNKIPWHPVLTFKRVMHTSLPLSLSLRASEWTTENKEISYVMNAIQYL